MPFQSPSAAEFDFLTPKQAEVLAMLANHRTSKEIAHALGISETSVNRRIEVVRHRLGGITRQELARRFLLWRSAKNSGSRARSSQTENIGAHGDEDVGAARATFEDPVRMTIDAPWSAPDEPHIVPRMLDGENATLTRGAAIMIILIAIVVSLILALAVAKALADAVR